MSGVDEDATKATVEDPRVAARPRAHGGPSLGNSKSTVVIVIGIGTLMAALDGSVVNTVLPVIYRALGSTVAVIEWVLTIYLFVVSVLLLAFGRLGDMYGHRSLYILGFALFSFGSALCGLAPTAAMLIAFRVVQATGAAMLYANSPALITKNFPGGERGRALGLLAMMAYLGLTAGPSLGGWLAHLYGWRIIFFINIPIGSVAIGAVLRVIPPDAVGARVERFDWPGAILFGVGLIGLLIALNKGYAWGWTSPLALAMLFGSALFLVVFAIIESHARYPMLDLGLFRSRLFAAAALSSVLNYMCVYTVIFILPFYLIQGRGFSTARAGLVLTALPLVMVAAAPLSGSISDRIGSRLPSTLGMATLAVGLFLLAKLGPTSPVAQVVAALAIVGLGAGTFVAPNNSALMGSAPRARRGVAGAVLATLRNVGMALGVGLGGAVFATVLAHSAANGTTSVLVAAVDATFLVMTTVAVVGILTSSVRGVG